MSAAQKNECPLAGGHFADQTKHNASNFIVGSGIVQAFRSIAFALVLNLPLLSGLILGVAL